MMDPNTGTKATEKELLDAQALIWNHIYSFQNSMALKCAIELGIADAIHKKDKPLPITELAYALAIHPNKAPALYRLMRHLVHSNFFSMKNLDNGKEAFDLTISSQLLLKDHPLSQAPMALAVINPVFTESPHHLSKWFQSDDIVSPFQIAHGKSIWDFAGCMPKFNEHFNRAMASDARFLSTMLVTNNDFKSLFEGVESIVDVGGGNGTMAKTIAEAYPKINCIVFDLPHVVDGLQGNVQNIRYVAGDMFQGIPNAQVVLLKWILHDWSDDHCIKILEKCKEVVRTNEKGGKVLIIDIVVGIGNDSVPHSANQILFDMEMMCQTGVGKERTEKEWKNLFDLVGFSNHKIYPILGSRSVIEVYP